MEPRTRSEAVSVLGIHVYLTPGNNNFVPQRASQLLSLSDDVSLPRQRYKMIAIITTIFTIRCVHRKHAIDTARTPETRTCYSALCQILRSESRTQFGG